MNKDEPEPAKPDTETEQEEDNADGDYNEDTPQEEVKQENDEEDADEEKELLPLAKITPETMLALFERIKTHFPAARIKKIMQLDDDIGKVAQVTPVIVGRALEIFMANLVECAIIELRKQGVKRILASHIRAAVENLEQFDFLVDSVAKYPPMKQ